MSAAPVILIHSRIASARLIAAWVVAGIALVVLLLPVGIAGIGLGLGFMPLPFALRLGNPQVMAVFHVHMTVSAVALLLAPCVIALRQRPRLHRTLGRVLGVCVVIGALTALPVAVFSHAAPIARAGLFAQGVVWLGLLCAGVVAIRRRDRATHIRMMLAMAAVMSGAIWFRLATYAAVAYHLPFGLTYAITAWLAWLVPLAIVLVWTHFVILRSRFSPLSPQTIRHSREGGNLGQRAKWGLSLFLINSPKRAVIKSLQCFILCGTFLYRTFARVETDLGSRLRGNDESFGVGVAKKRERE